jgi:hypothetical protein
MQNEKIEKEAEATLVTMTGVMADNFDEASYVHFQFLQHADYRSVVLTTIKHPGLCQKHGSYSTIS